MQASNLLLDIKKEKQFAGLAMLCRMQEMTFSVAVNKQEHVRTLSSYKKTTKLESPEKQTINCYRNIKQ
jgi:hypothetical protein